MLAFFQNQFPENNITALCKLLQLATTIKPSLEGDHGEKIMQSVWAEIAKQIDRQ